MGRTYRKLSKQDKEAIKRRKRKQKYGDDYDKPKRDDRKNRDQDQNNKEKYNRWER